MTSIDLDLSKYQLGWSDDVDYVFKPKKGLDEALVREMSQMKGEPEWMLKRRLKSLGAFEKRPMPRWGGDMSEIYFNDIYYYIKPTDHQVDSWDDLPDAIKSTYEKLGIPEAEASTSPASPPSSSPRSCSTATAKTSSSSASSSATWTPRSVSTPSS